MGSYPGQAIEGMVREGMSLSGQGSRQDVAGVALNRNTDDVATVGLATNLDGTFRLEILDEASRRRMSSSG